MIEETPMNSKSTIRHFIYNISVFLNSGVTIFLLSLVNGYLYSELSGSYSNGQQIDISVCYATAIVGVIISIVSPGRLHLFKNLSLISASFILLIARDLGRSAISLACIIIALFHAAFLLLRRYLDYTHIPFSLLVGFKFTLIILMFFQQFFTFSESSMPPENLNITDYFYLLVNTIKSHGIEKLIITIIGSAIMVVFLNKYPKIPWNTVLIISGVFFFISFKQFHTVLTLGELISVNSSYINLSDMLKHNLFNLSNYELLLNQKLWVYSFGFSIFIWYETMITINYVRDLDFKYTNSRLETFGLIVGNLISGVFGFLPITNGFVANMQLKGLKSLHRFNYTGGLLFLLIIPLSCWTLIRYIPVAILPIFFISMLLAEIKKSDIEFFVQINKGKLFFVILVPLICLYIDIVYAFVFSMIIYHVIYGYNRGTTFYNLDNPNHFFNRVIKYAK